MFLTYQNPVYAYVKSPDQDVTTPVHHPLIVVGAGPVGMAAAIDAEMPACLPGVTAPCRAPVIWYGRINMSVPAGAASIFPEFPQRWRVPPALPEEKAVTLKSENNFHQPGKRFFRPYRPGDDFYEALIETHRDLSEEQSARVNARLVLLLSNHIGDL